MLNNHKWTIFAFLFARLNCLLTDLAFKYNQFHGNQLVNLVIEEKDF